MLALYELVDQQLVEKVVPEPSIDKALFGPEDVIGFLWATFTLQAGD